MLSAIETAQPDVMLPPSWPQDPVVAAIDVGTNSIHMVIVRIDSQIPSFRIIDRVKETVRLGEYCNQTGALTEAAMQRSYEALARFLTIAGSHHPHAVIAVATSAVREAPNGYEFLHRVQEGLGLTVDLISGAEEARRIYLGVLSAMELDQKPHVVMDIGGGSTELILGDGREPDFLRSIKVGAVRLTQQFLASDPPARKEFVALQEYVRGMVEGPVDRIKQLLKGNPVRMVGTSGTIETLVSQTARQLDQNPNNLHGYDLSRQSVTEFLHLIKDMPLKDRLKIPGLVERRAEIVVAGAVILHEVMTLLDAPHLTYCTRALREGLIVDWMLTQGLIEDRLRYQSSVRQRHVLKLAHKYHVEMPYTERVADFALSLFDQTQGILHQWGVPERELLWAAAILHNSGHFISHGSHHKHSYYLIRHGELLGYNEEEVEIIANLARYHRKSPPKKKHENFQNLPLEQHRQMVLELSPLLRLASALDRRRTHTVKSLTCSFSPNVTSPKGMTLLLEPTHPDDDCALELWSLQQKKDVFEQQFKMLLEIKKMDPSDMQS
jgi:exopolyphosphatase/guanosine-5'-triphosphate,3'-diphosphate pyrophosphatase